MARTKAQRERDRLEADVIRQRQKLEDLERKSVVTVCSKHDWRVTVTDGRPAPPVSECPGCKLGAVGSRAGEKFETRKVTLAEQTGETPSMAFAYERYLAQQDGIRPGSVAEQDALEVIEQAREEEKKRQEVRASGFPRGARLAYASRIEDGQIVGTYALPRRIKAVI